MIFEALQALQTFSEHQRGPKTHGFRTSQGLEDPEAAENDELLVVFGVVHHIRHVR